MHELSIALEVCRITEEHIGRHRLSRVRKIGVDVGDRSGIEIDNLEFCLGVLLGSPPFGSGLPEIQRLAGDELHVTYVEVDEDDDPQD